MNSRTLGRSRHLLFLSGADFLLDAAYADKKAVCPAALLAMRSLMNETLGRSAAGMVLACSILAVPSHSAPSKQISDLGPTKIHARLVTVVGDCTTMKGFTGESEHYSFSGDLLHIYRSPGTGTGSVSPAGKGGVSIDHADAAGKIKLSVEDIEEGTKNIVTADKLTFVRDTTGKTDGTLTFTGHVAVETHYAKALAQPSLTTFDTMTVVLGKKPDYPKVSGENMNGDFVFLRGNE